MFVTIGKLFNICVHDNNECISSTLRTKNSWETYITEVFLEIFKKLKNSSTLFIDIGANIGYYSLLASSQGIKVVAFEPVVKNLELFEQSIWSNNFEKLIKVHNIGIGEKKYRAMFNTYDDNMGLCRPVELCEQITIPISSTEEVQIDTINEYINFDGIDNVVVKINVESMELEVLRSFDKLLESTKIKYILIEISRVGKKHLEVINIFKKYGFTKVYFIEDNTKNKLEYNTEYLEDQRYIFTMENIEILAENRNKINVLFFK